MEEAVAFAQSTLSRLRQGVAHVAHLDLDATLRDIVALIAYEDPQVRNPRVCGMHVHVHGVRWLRLASRLGRPCSHGLFMAMAPGAQRWTSNSRKGCVQGCVRTLMLFAVATCIVSPAAACLPAPLRHAAGVAAGAPSQHVAARARGGRCQQRHAGRGSRQGPGAPAPQRAGGAAAAAGGRARHAARAQQRPWGGVCAGTPPAAAAGPKIGWPDGRRCAAAYLPSAVFRLPDAGPPLAGGGAGGVYHTSLCA